MGVKAFYAAVAIAAWTALLWAFFFRGKRAVTAAPAVGGVQEVAITVHGGYAPDTIRVVRGRPVRLKFTRRETSACSAHVVFPDFRINKALPAGETTVVEFTPDQAGEFAFSCAMGMYQGKLIVEEAAPAAHH